MTSLRIPFPHPISSRGFTLLEMLVMLVIAGLATAWALPAWQRQSLQGQVDRYVDNLEAGLFDLKAQAGKNKVSFISTPPELEVFKEPWELVEFTKSDGSRIDGSDNRLCIFEGDQKKCASCESNDPETCDEATTRDSRYRFLKLENSREAQAVEVKIHLNGSQTDFEITPPGTINYDDVVFVVRSRQHASMTSQPLKERCLKLSGNGFLSQGNWNESTDTCISR